MASETIQARDQIQRPEIFEALAGGSVDAISDLPDAQFLSA